NEARMGSIRVPPAFSVVPTRLLSFCGFDTRGHTDSRSSAHPRPFHSCRPRRRRLHSDLRTHSSFAMGNSHGLAERFIFLASGFHDSLWNLAAVGLVLDFRATGGKPH